MDKMQQFLNIAKNGNLKSNEIDISTVFKERNAKIPRSPQMH